MEDLYKDITILYVEDDESIREGYKRALKKYCNHLLLASNGVEGVEMFEKHAPDIIVSDINMPKLNGIKMAKQIKEQNPNQFIIFTTAYSDSEYTVEALELQVEGYLLKPVDKVKLKERLQQLAKSIYLEKENKKQQLIINHILSSSYSMLVLTDFESISFASNSFYELLGVNNHEDFFQKYESFLNVFIQHDDYLFAKTKEELLHRYEERTEEKRVVSVIDSDFDAKAFTIHIDTIEFEDKKQYLISLSDISKIQAQKKAYEHKAYFDGLTGVANRAKIEEHIHTEFQRFNRYGTVFSIAILDIDHFKSFNDTYGHLIGDEMLIALAHTIDHHTRELDCFARWGGEEFILLMPQTECEDAKKVCEGLKEEVMQIRHEVAGSITASFGVTQVQQQDDPTSLFKRCDDALYKAKKNGRNRVEAL